VGHTSKNERFHGNMVINNPSHKLGSTVDIISFYIGDDIMQTFTEQSIRYKKKKKGKRKKEEKRKHRTGET